MEALIILFTITVIILFVLAVLYKFDPPFDYEPFTIFNKKVEKHTVYCISAFLLLAFVAVINITGAFPNKSKSGVCNLHIADVYQSGCFAKSTTATVMFPGNTTELLKISTSDKGLGQKLYDYNGKTVKVEYRSWALSPYYLGSCNEVLYIYPLVETE